MRRLGFAPVTGKIFQMNIIGEAEPKIGIYHNCWKFPVRLLRVLLSTISSNCDTPGVTLVDVIPKIVPTWDESIDCVI